MSLTNNIPHGTSSICLVNSSITNAKKIRAQGWSFVYNWGLPCLSPTCSRATYLFVIHVLNHVNISAWDLFFGHEREFLERFEFFFFSLFFNFLDKFKKEKRSMMHVSMCMRICIYVMFVEKLYNLVVRQCIIGWHPSFWWIMNNCMKEKRSCKMRK